MLVFPRDHGAHPDTRTEWWYATGWLGALAAPTHGFQITFFRSRTGLAADSTSRFAARHLLFAHAAVTDLAARRHLHAARIARWNGEPQARPDFAALDDAALQIDRWSLRREDGPGAARWRARVDGEGFALDLELERTQPLLLQGDAGFSRKGPDERQASHYYSEPQLAARARLVLQGRRLEATGRGWFDQEWSEELLHPDAVGWDWIGMNLADGSALTAFQLRRASDGGAAGEAGSAALWAGGSFRPAGGATRAFGADEVRFVAGRPWRSAATHALYPVEWQLDTPAGRFGVRALLDPQELAGSGTTGMVYWEGLAELQDAGGRRVGLGYLEMTGYAARLRLG
jgi:predicted secreted hydrolase